MNLSNWKEDYFGPESKHNITTNSLWISKEKNDSPSTGVFVIPERDYLSKNSKDFHGLWIPEIPYQMIMRFTEEGNTVWSIFGGSGTDYYVANHLNRNIIINDLHPQESFIQQGDSATFNPGKQVDLILAHPPYWDMVEYSQDENDGSSQESLSDFLLWWEKVVQNVSQYLKPNGYFVLCCGNMYRNSEEIELGELLKWIVYKEGFKLKQHIIKDYGETKGSNMKNYNLNYYRKLNGGYGDFYGDNLFVLKKEKSKNHIIENLKKLI